MAYCAHTDLLTGDIPRHGKYGDGTGFVNLTADEIDAEIGHIYVTPIEFDESDPVKAARVRPAKLLLKKINTLLASGRIILDMAAGGEDRELHAYGKSMVDEALLLLGKLGSGKIDLRDAPRLEPEESDGESGPIIRNEDSESLVEGFYTQYGFGQSGWYPGMPARPRPYGGNS